MIPISNAGHWFSRNSQNTEQNRTEQNTRIAILLIHLKDIPTCSQSHEAITIDNKSGCCNLIPLRVLWQDDVEIYVWRHVKKVLVQP